MSADADPAGYAVFRDGVRLAAGPPAAVAEAARADLAQDPAAALLVIDRATGAVVDLDLRGTAAEVAARHAPPPRAAPAEGPPRRGRPRLGVVAREVTLLPRHWDWLSAQPGGASVALRRLVDAASKADAATGRAARDRAYRVMAALAGDLPGFEEAARALFAGDRAALANLAAAWPPDVADEVTRLLDAPA